MSKAAEVFARLEASGTPREERTSEEMRRMIAIGMAGDEVSYTVKCVKCEKCTIVRFAHAYIFPESNLGDAHPSRISETLPSGRAFPGVTRSAFDTLRDMALEGERISKQTCNCEE